MRISKHINDLLLGAIIVGTLSGSYFVSRTSEKPIVFINKQQSSFNVNIKFWDYFHLGQKRLISSLLWIATILESDNDHYKSRDLNSWMFLRFKTISILEPKFYETYAFGAPYLSIVKDDLNGASDLYLEGLKIYPDDLYLLKNASFHFYYEVEDYNIALEVLNKLKVHPNVNLLMLTSLARLNSQNGSLEDAFNILRDTYLFIKDKEIKLAEKIRQNLYSLRAEIDLNCLNNGSVSCSKLDLDGEPYLKITNGQYVAKKKWAPFKIKRKKNEKS